MTMDRITNKSPLTFFGLQTPRHTIGNLQIFFFHLTHLYLLSSTEHIIYADINVYFKKENRSSAPGNQSLHDVGVRRDSEREMLDTLHILLLLRSH